MDQHAWPDRTTPLQSAWSMGLGAMMAECEQFVYLFSLNVTSFQISNTYHKQAEPNMHSTNNILAV